jgi:hypothetical protein
MPLIHAAWILILVAGGLWGFVLLARRFDA